MSDRNNDVFQVLVADGNQAVLTAGQEVSNLAAGQIGVFDANTHRSISAVTTPLPKDFYLAVGINRSGGATFEDFRESAGQHIQRKNITGYTFGAHSAAQPMIVDINSIRGACNEDFTIRVEQRNSKIAGIQGYNQFSEAFSVRGACCDGCGDDCQDADPNDIAIKLADAINKNSATGLSATLLGNTGTVNIGTEPTTDGNVTVKLGSEAVITIAILNLDTEAEVNTKIANAINAVTGSAYKASATPTQVNISGPAGAVVFTAGTTGIVAVTGNVTRTLVPVASTYLAANPGATLGLAIQGASVPTVQSDSINMAYHKFHQTYIIVSIVETDRDKVGCAFAKTSIFQELREEEGTGANIRQKEYHASAWNGAGPYVASQTLGLAIGNLEFFAAKNGTYDQIILEYFFKAESGWLEYENTLSTIVAIPEASTVTRNALITIIDALVTPFGFDALLDDAATANVNPAVVEAQPASAAVDGIA